MKRLLNIFISFSLAIFIISSSVILGLKCKSLYYYDVKNLNISSMSGFSENEIKLNYDYLIDYNLNKNVGEFNLPTIKYSEEGKIHFEEVRNIFQMIKKVFYISGVISILGIIISIKNALNDITKSQIEDLTLLDDYDTPKLKDYYSLFDEIIFFPTFKKTKIIECRPITFQKSKTS